MTINITQVISTMTTKQKVMAGVFAVIVVIVLWQGMSIFSGGSDVTPTPITTPATSAMSANAPGGTAQAPTPAPRPATPQTAQLLKQTPEVSEREQALLRAQQETQARYLATLNELTNLKMSLQVAETNAALMKAKLATIVTQKSIVDLLSKPAAPQVAPGGYAQGLVNPAATGPIQQGPPPEDTDTSNYTVISVSQLQYKWAAVLGVGGSLYNVMAGDVLPADGSVVIAIDKTGVIIEKNGTRKKISMVPII